MIAVLWIKIGSWPRYEASSSGDIRCALTGIVIKPRLMGGPTRAHRRYAVQLLADDGAYKWRFVGRLVCEAFHGPPPSSIHQAAHDNGQGLDNRSANLIWKTPRDNNHDRYGHGTMPQGERAANSILTEQQVLEMRGEYQGMKADADRRGKRRLPNGSIDKIAARFGVSNRTARAAITGESWRHL